MTQPTHTPEPWISIFGYIGEEAKLTQPPGWDSPLGPTLAEANFAEDAQRIVQCVNACAGMDDPAAEVAQMRQDLLEAAEIIQHLVDGWEGRIAHRVNELHRWACNQQRNAIFRRLLTLYNAKEANTWLDVPHPLLESKKPITLIYSGQACRVHDLLNGIEEGAFL